MSFSIFSFLEIYNEKVRDLLVDEASNGDGSGRSLRIREHPKKGPYVQGKNSKLFISYLKNNNIIYGVLIFKTSYS